MQHECRITVLETKVFPEYQEKYLADPKPPQNISFEAVLGPGVIIGLGKVQSYQWFVGSKQGALSNQII